MSVRTLQKPEPRQRRQDKVAKIPIKVEHTIGPLLKKPRWLKVKAPTGSKVMELKNILRDQELNTVCEEASCPNIGECFSNGTATFMIMGNLCTRRCPFCDVAHGRPLPLDSEEPKNLAEVTALMGLRYVVITSVDRDDLRDGGASHFVSCIRAVRTTVKEILIEILVPDFRGRMEKALDILADSPPDVFNHNLETVEALYPAVRPGSDYAWSLTLIKNFKEMVPQVPTKSGLMLGLGETREQVIQTLVDLRRHHCDRLTLGQYLQPSKSHLPVKRFIPPTEFSELAEYARNLGFSHVASGPLVRSSYHADRQSAGHNVS
jgi:lipoic acid synthetase